MYNIATTSLFNVIDREVKELLPYSIFIITGCYKRVEIRQLKRRFLVYFNKMRPTALSNIIYNIATTSSFNAIDKEAKELLPRSIFIIIRRYKRVEIRQ